MGEVILAACTDGQGILVSDLHSGAVVNTFEDSATQPNVFGTIGESSSHIFAVQAKKALWHVWSWDDKKPCYRASLPEKITAMTFTNDGLLCFGGSISGSIYVWQLGTGSLLRCWPAHFRELTRLLVSQDESVLISASADSTVHAYNLADIFCEQTPQPFHSWSGHSLPVTSIVQLPGSGLQQTIVSASLDRSVRIWDVGTGRCIGTHSLAAPIHSMSASPSGAEVFCACGDGEIRIVNPSCGDREGSASCSGHTGAVVSCSLNADGSRLASCSDVDRVRVWETRTRQCISQLHTNRNVQISSLRIVHRASHATPLPPFQPFQRLLTAPENSPPVPMYSSGRSLAVQNELVCHANAEEFIDHIVWGQAAGLGESAKVQQCEERLAQAQVEHRRWAAAAAELYDALLESGRELPVPASASRPVLQAAEVPSLRTDEVTALPEADSKAGCKESAMSSVARIDTADQASGSAQVGSPRGLAGIRKPKRRKSTGTR